MHKSHGDLTISLPPWLADYQKGYANSVSVHDQMTFVIGASRRNVIEQTGGPFAAGVFEVATGRLVALGVNLVEQQSLSVLHGEILALMLAQRALSSYDLNAAQGAPYGLVTSAEPCAMCLAAIPWSGVSRVVAGATDADVRAIGFDEGQKPADWRAVLERAGIQAVAEVCRQEAASVLQAYQASGGVIYNGGHSHKSANGVCGSK
ncbi:nucleoside deaminase [Marinobacter mobilis]|uniref:tRNA(Arg) A34 adenosine deaminase TadA n=1 Tax=Marinobacter mobilis TaxID=488533 RepID=A0A1H3C484_9GAMM|nr:nucleoside deaminase [Marinobacter mobilis]SDX01187.1 tRNA(Arg) A34 adenosine deaminase TadA [Marinobacter mobilis]SDX48885.1 tRNA(Arg) A34 adenosine deaminase TadA [Marinobacter mobilis]